MTPINVAVFIFLAALGAAITFLSDYFVSRRPGKAAKSGPARRFVISAVCAALLFAIWLRAGYGAPCELVCLWAFFAVLVCLSDVDFRAGIIPNPLVFSALALSVFRLFLPRAPGALDAAGGLLAGALPLLLAEVFFRLMFKKSGVGYGDVKLIAACGLFLGGAASAVLALALAFILAGLYSAVLIALKKAGRGSYIPLGPFITAGTALAYFFGTGATTWYGL